MHVTEMGTWIHCVGPGCRCDNSCSVAPAGCICCLVHGLRYIQKRTSMLNDKMCVLNTCVSHMSVCAADNTKVHMCALLLLCYLNQLPSRTHAPQHTRRLPPSHKLTKKRVIHSIAATARL